MLLSDVNLKESDNSGKKVIKKKKRSEILLKTKKTPNSSGQWFSIREFLDKVSRFFCPSNEKGDIYANECPLSSAVFKSIPHPLTHFLIPRQDFNLRVEKLRFLVGTETMAGKLTLLALFGF
ncbi:hypothetical protein CEXT_305051 [Caerostris extrusa]|uniref:Uncharacterized protein n=1 Tax=Caerostris extrusa TaxID=172846 RepID=A0AAV4NVP4_CAEEX|nr:hypothetical protein CEXT_305051 [Caerostris extrusa]